MIKLFILVLLIGSFQLSRQCPTANASTTTWKLSFDVSAGLYYLELIGDSSGYYQYTGFNFSEFGLLSQLSNGTTVEWLPSIEDTGFSCTSGCTVNGNQISYSGRDNTKVYGSEISTLSVLSFIFTTQDLDVCFGIGKLTAINNYETCLSSGVMASGYTCETYSNYPCDISCTTGCSNPTSTGCCNAICATCFGSTYTQCYTCSSGYYLQPSPSNTTCLSTCPTYYYPNTTTSVCTGNLIIPNFS